MNIRWSDFSFRTFTDFLRQGLVEYLDVNEEGDSNMSVYEKDINRYGVDFIPSRSIVFSSLGKQRIWKLNHLHYLVHVLVLFRIHITINHHVTHINVRWVNKPCKSEHQQIAFRRGDSCRGAIGYNQSQRCDTLLYLLVYPQRPMVKTRV